MNGKFARSKEQEARPECKSISLPAVTPAYGKFRYALPRTILFDAEIINNYRSLNPVSGNYFHSLGLIGTRSTGIFRGTITVAFNYDTEMQFYDRAIFQNNLTRGIFLTGRILFHN